MSKKNQLQSNMRIINDWANRLFMQQSHTPQIKLCSRKTNTGSIFERELNDQDWYERLFTTAARAVRASKKILVIRDKKIVCEFALPSQHSEVFIGSHSMADIVLHGNKIDPFYAKIRCCNGKYQLENLDSERSIFLNGKKMLTNAVVDLQDGAVIRIMAYTIRLVIQ